MKRKLTSSTPTDSITGSPCAHRQQPDMDYVHWHEDGDRRLANGEKQTKCPTCGLYVWGEFWKPAPKSNNGGVNS